VSVSKSLWRRLFAGRNHKYDRISQKLY